MNIILKKTLLLVVSGGEKGNCYPKRELTEKADSLDQLGIQLWILFHIGFIKQEERPNFKCIVCRIEYNNHDQTYHYRGPAWINADSPNLSKFAQLYHQISMKW